MAKKTTKNRKIILLVYLILSIVIINIFYSRKPFATIQNFIFTTSQQVVFPAPTPIPIPLKSLHAPILVYHYVEYVKDQKDTIRKSLNIPPDIFIRQIKTLKNAGYTFVTASELIDILDGKIKSPRKPIVISFDDGYRDFYTDVFPILKKYQVKAVAYIVSGFLDKPNYMFVQQLKEIARSGLVEIGSHTVNHVSLKGIALELAKNEIKGGKTALESLLNIPIVSFAYPDGRFDNQAINLVENAGFKSAVTTTHGFEVHQNNKYSIYRIHPGDKTDEILLNFLE